MKSASLVSQMRQLLLPGDAIWWGQATAEPVTLTRALTSGRHTMVGGARLGVFVGIGNTDTLRPEQADIFDFFGYAASGPHRELAKAGVLDILPCHYSQLPSLIRSGKLPADVALVQVSPPDEAGRYSLGHVHEYIPAVLDNARVIIAEICADVPWTFGTRYLTEEEIDLLVPSESAAPDTPRAEPGVAEQAIARYVSGLVEDGATLQIGIGNLPEAVLAALMNHHDLGLHSGAVPDGVVPLVESGALTNARKGVDVSIGIGGILMGGERLRRWAHRNASFQLRETSYTHNPEVLASLSRFTAINSAIEVDLTGQVNSEVAGGVYVGAVGGAADFLRGAARSRGGLPIVALPSRAKGLSRIVAKLSGPVSTARSDAGLIVTEYGVADLRGQTLSRRVRRILDVAAPEHREALEIEAHRLLRQCGANFHCPVCRASKAEPTSSTSD